MLLESTIRLAHYSIMLNITWKGAFMTEKDLQTYAEYYADLMEEPDTVFDYNKFVDESGKLMVEVRTQNNGSVYNEFEPYHFKRIWQKAIEIYIERS